MKSTRPTKAAASLWLLLGTGSVRHVPSSVGRHDILFPLFTHHGPPSVLFSALLYRLSLSGLCHEGIHPSRARLVIQVCSFRPVGLHGLPGTLSLPFQTVCQFPRKGTAGEALQGEKAASGSGMWRASVCHKGAASAPFAACATAGEDTACGDLFCRDFFCISRDHLTSEPQAQLCKEFPAGDLWLGSLQSSRSFSGARPSAKEGNALGLLVPIRSPSEVLSSLPSLPFLWLNLPVHLPLTYCHAKFGSGLG